MRTSWIVLLLIAACHRAPPATGTSVQAEPTLSEPSKAAALRDLRQNIAAVRAAIANQQSPVYATDKLLLAARELGGEKDDGVLRLLAEAETVYGHDAPVAWADTKLADAAAHPAAKADDCATARQMLDRVSGKYKDDAQVLAIVQRVKASCPRVRSAGGSSSSGGGGTRIDRGSSSGPNRAAQRDDCRRRCDDAAFSCRASCQYCGSCTTDKTWEWCNATCNNCKQGCEQNEKFCRAACGD
jgi:hypothetical protein